MATIGVLGPGGVGGLIAARLGAAGHDVTVVATERTAAEITARGLSFQAPGAAPRVSFPTARPWLTAPVEVLVVAVKATELLAAVQRVPAAVLGSATVVPLLNGVDHLPVLRALYPRASVVAASIAVEAARRRPGVVEQLSRIADLVVADGTPAGAAVAELLRAAGLTVTTDADEQTVLWRKLSFLDPFALLTTGTNAPIGEALRLKESWLRPLVDEAAAAAATWNVRIDADAVEARIRSLPATMQSSMLRDRRDGRALELDAIAGPVIRALGATKATTTVEVARTILAAG
ncbi:MULTISPECIES: ketopantoate reductase family protein [unclassified Crossiella]|uniref:ketopantoate reductase family protein n=1 Tax=unclassified Crossiella TaxID=2620835 RepID=UPI001FFE4A00|nr:MULTISPECIES: 2-dehydropantoate 2-reductase [unclassified Crossiella]MCK2242774.1 2-dehydropantoate 2-reductase [Crossiella sp. S99.2]MCK2256651.1 2-dehydropantoate 2-reductase [Crossiella sp. S99.1]